MNFKFIKFVAIFLTFVFVPFFSYAQIPSLSPEPVFSAQPVQYQEILEPTISISPDYFYTFDEVLYIEGRSNPNAIVTVTLQKQGEQPVKFTIKADSSGEWVVAEKAYLSAGNWQVRAKQQVGGILSGESNPRVIRSIVTGVNIFGLNIRYVVIAIVVFAFLFTLLIVFIYFHRKIARLKKGLLEKHLHETEERFHKGFAELREDLMDQLKDLANNTAGRVLTPEEIDKRDRIIRQLEELEQNLEHDIGDISRKAE